MQKNKEILIMRLSAMGDVAMTIPIIEELRRKYNNLGITILTQKVVVPLFSHIEGVRVIAWDTNEYGKFIDIFKMFYILRKTIKFDAVFDLHDVWRTKVIRLLFRLYGVKVYCIDKGRSEKKKLIAGQHHQLKTTIQRYIDTLSEGGLDINLSGKLTRRIVDIPKSITEIIGEKKGTWIGVAPFAKHKGKAYPLALMERVLDTLSQDENITLFIFSGGGKELEQAKTLAKRYRNAIAIFGKIKLDGELQLIANIDCMITMDSSAMHFASSVGTPVVSVWGATHPWAGFLGYGQSKDNVVDVEMDCRPCSIFGDKPCVKTGKAAYECMKNIKPEAIVDRVFKALSE